MVVVLEVVMACSELLSGDSYETPHLDHFICLLEKKNNRIDR